MDGNFAKFADVCAHVQGINSRKRGARRKNLHVRSMKYTWKGLHAQLMKWNAGKKSFKENWVMQHLKYFLQYTCYGTSNAIQ